MPQWIKDRADRKVELRAVAQFDIHVDESLPPIKIPTLATRALERW
jgi:hypothetical protein